MSNGKRNGKARNGDMSYYEKEGVFYTPSPGEGLGKSRRQTRDYGRSNEYRVERRQESGRLKPQKSQFAAFYIITLIVCVVICLTVFAIVFQMVFKDTGSKEQITGKEPIVSATPKIVATEEPSGAYISALGVIQTISRDQGQLKMLDIETNKLYNLIIKTSTIMLDRYNQPLVLAEFNTGDIVDVSFDSETSSLKSLAISPAAWEYKNIKNLRVDTEKRKVTYGNDVYSYDDKLISLYGGEPNDIGIIRPVDVVTIRGYREKLYFIALTSSHGIIGLTNKDKIDKGVLEINTNLFMSLDEADEIEVPVGNHKVVVRGANIEPFTKEITVNHSDKLLIDLAQVKFKEGSLDIKVNQDDFTLYIDGKKVNANEIPVTLNFGEYDIKVEKERFTVFEEKVIIADEKLVLQVDLVPIIETPPPTPSSPPAATLSKLTISTEPSDAVIYVDGVLEGKAPLSIPLSYGEHIIKISLEGYTEISMPVELTDKEHKYIFTLQKIPV